MLFVHLLSSYVFLVKRNPRKESFCFIEIIESSLFLKLCYYTCVMHYQKRIWTQQTLIKISLYLCYIPDITLHRSATP